METSKYRLATEQTRNKEFYLNWPTSDE